MVVKNGFRALRVTVGLAVMALIMYMPAHAQSAPIASQAGSQTDTNATQAGGKPLVTHSNEGFWGHLNPFARKRWVNRQLNPVKERLNELDELSTKQATDIKSVDERAQAGISRAQQTADGATQQSAVASATAASAQSLATQSGARTQQLSSTVANLDQYQPISDTEIRFRAGQRVLNAKAKDALDGIAVQLQGQKGYLIEVQGYSRSKGTVGVQSSQRLADSVVRYLVEQHQVPVYRIHVVGMGAAPVQNSEGETVSGSVVHVTLVQNSLAALNSSGTSGSSPIGLTQQAPRGSALTPSAQ